MLRPLLRFDVERPLLRPQLIDQLVAEAAVIQIAAGRQLFVFVEDLCWAAEPEEAWKARAQLPFKPPGKIADDGPVGSRLAWRRHG